MSLYYFFFYGVSSLLLTMVRQFKEFVFPFFSSDKTAAGRIGACRGYLITAFTKVLLYQQQIFL